MAEKNRRVTAGSVLRRLTDLAMALLLLFLMAYSITEQEIHEWLGVGILVLFLLHHGLNWKWFRFLARGRYAPQRILQTALVLLLFVSMAAQIVSGLAMARHIPSFLKVSIPMHTARLLHMACGYWSFLLSSLHLGFHWHRRWNPGKKILVGGVGLWGGVCFVQQNIFDYLFLRTEFVFFDYDKAPLLILAELAAIMVLWMQVGYLFLLFMMRFGHDL